LDGSESAFFKKKNGKGSGDAVFVGMKKWG
jgi:hypothetical protein